MLTSSLALCFVTLVPHALTVSPGETARGADEIDLGNRWDQWRGPTRDGRFHGPQWPAELNEERLELVWDVAELGSSYSTPVVTVTHVFTTASTEDGQEVVYAFERDSGDEAWMTAWDGEMKVPFFAARNGSWIRSSPAFDGESLFVAGMRDVLVCIDAATGDVRWTVDFVEREGTNMPSFGFASSPLVVGDAVYVQAGGAITKLDKRTGKTQWRSMEGGTGMDSPFSSPIHARLLGRDQLVVLTRSHMCGVEPADGGVIWSRKIEAFRGMNILTPMTWGDDAVFTAPYGGKTQLLTLEANEGDDGHEVVVEQAWTTRAQGNMTSPVIFDSHAYYYSRSNRFVCVDLETGDDAWISEPTGDSYWSLVQQEGRILALADTGLLRLIEATPEEYRVLGEVEVAEGSTWAHLALAGNQLFVRELESMLVYAWE